MRSKEEAHDYRYFPDPDLLPLVLTQTFVDDLAANLPELPDEKKDRFAEEYGLTVYDAEVLVADRQAADYFEAVAEGLDGKAAANWVINEIMGRLNREGGTFADVPASPDASNAILKLTADGTISGKIAKDLLEIVWNEGGDPEKIVEERGLKQVTDTGARSRRLSMRSSPPIRNRRNRSGPSRKRSAGSSGRSCRRPAARPIPQAVNRDPERKNLNCH